MKNEKKITRLIMMSGLSASGKSTVAESLQKEVYPDAIRLNKDLMRKMFHFGEYSWKNEKFINMIEEILAEVMLEEGTDVIIDDTNLKPYHENKWAKIAKDTGAMFINVTQNTDWEECIKRDEQRARDGKDSVGPDVIKRQAMETGKVNGQFVICDLDGTLCDITHRRHLVSGKDNKSWEKFFANIPGDVPRTDICNFVKRIHNSGIKVVYLTGRPEDYKEDTLAWLSKYGLDFNFTLVMRNKGDKRPDVEVKREMLNKYFPNREQILMVIDDRPCVVRMWQEELGDGKVIDVGDGVEF